MEGIDSILLEQIKEIEERDESQVLAEMAGETVADYIYELEVYDYKKKAKVRKVRLSWVGTREVARSRGNIMLSEPIFTETDTDIRFVVRATDLKRNFTVFGGCHQPKQQKIKEVDKNTDEVIGYHLETDEYYFPKGLSKAQRNALNLCIPGDYAAKMIDRFLKLAGKPLATNRQIPQETRPVKSQIKPRNEWDKITKEQLSDLPTLERMIWNLTKLQPIQMYKELGYTTKADVTQTAWDCFLILKDRFVPDNIIGGE